jgi:type IV pilus assembly protein PilX
MKPSQSSYCPMNHQQRGASLIVVMMILMIVSLLGVGGAQIALMSERGARNDRDLQVARQAAEAALLDAEVDMMDTTKPRQSLFDGKSRTGFMVGCGTSTADLSAGLCDITVSGKPAWLTIDFTNTAANAPSTAFGTFTGRLFATGAVGVQPAQAPRYIIELLEDPLSKKSVVYRVTAMGFGPRTDIQAVIQMIYRVS